MVDTNNKTKIMTNANQLADISPEHCDYAVKRLERIAGYLGSATLSDYDREIHIKQKYRLEQELVIAHAAIGYKLPEGFAA